VLGEKAQSLNLGFGMHRTESKIFNILVKIFLRFDAFSMRDLVLHGIVSQSNWPSIINGKLR
jgi:hypothetical protein